MSTGTDTGADEEPCMCFCKACDVDESRDIYITSSMWQNAFQLVIHDLTVKENDDIVYRTPPGTYISLQFNEPSWSEPGCGFSLHIFAFSPCEVKTFVILAIHCVLVTGPEAEVEFGWSAEYTM